MFISNPTKNWFKRIFFIHFSNSCSTLKFFKASSMFTKKPLKTTKVFCMRLTLSSTIFLITLKVILLKEIQVNIRSYLASLVQFPDQQASKEDKSAPAIYPFLSITMLLFVFLLPPVGGQVFCNTVNLVINTSHKRFTKIKGRI